MGCIQVVSEPSCCRDMDGHFIRAHMKRDTAIFLQNDAKGPPQHSLFSQCSRKKLVLERINGGRPGYFSFIVSRSFSGICSR